jgi:hypothetical protein
MGRLLIAALGALALAGQAAAQSVDFSADLRAIAAQGLPSYLNGGLGELRFDPDHDGLALGYLRAGFHDDLSDLVHINVQAFLYNTQDNNPIDLTEAYAELRPVPQSAWRSRLKLGAFYPGISLENRMSGWRSPYTLSPSAINTWVGEEIRTIGAEYNLDWLGLQTGHPFEFGATAALYGWNDAAGVVMASRGWAIDDRQTGLFGRVPVAG